MTIRVEKNFLLATDTPGAEEIVPELAHMEPNDSIYIQNVGNSGFPPVSSVSVYRYGLKNNKEFMAEYDDWGLRVWRTK
jgi:hypothetical protein